MCECLYVCSMSLAPFMNHKLLSSGLKLNQVPLSLVCTLLSLYWSKKSIQPLVHEDVSTLQQPQLSTSEAEICHGGHLIVRLRTWMHECLDAYAYLDSYCKSMPVFSVFFFLFFSLCPAIVSIDYTESQRMAQIKATMWRF